MSVHQDWIHLHCVLTFLILGIAGTVGQDYEEQFAPMRPPVPAPPPFKSRTTPPTTRPPLHSGKHELFVEPPTTKKPKSKKPKTKVPTTPPPLPPPIIGRAIVNTPVTTTTSTTTSTPSPTTTTTETTTPSPTTTTTTTTTPSPTTTTTTSTPSPTTTTTTTTPSPTTTTTTIPTTTTVETTPEPVPTTTEPIPTTPESVPTTTEPVPTTPIFTTAEPTTEKPEEESPNISEEPPKISRDKTPKISELSKRPASGPISGRSAVGVPPPTGSGDDPFSVSTEWAIFNQRMDNLTIMLLRKMKPVYSIFTDSNEEFKINRTGLLENLNQYLNDKHLKGIIELLRPVQDELERNKAFTAINPAIDLPTIADVIAFAKTYPTTEIDKGRLKWMEINSMASTIHHIFKRLFPNFEGNGRLEEVNRTMGIPYPSWVSEFIFKENENTFQDLIPANLTSYIHDQMNILGDQHHLLRILEKLLNHAILNTWDPSGTSLNMYCFGNNLNGQIHKKFDVLMDAALFLCLADMKFAVFEMTNAVYMAWEAEKGTEAKIDLEAFRPEIETRLKTRLERKYRISSVRGENIDTPLAPKRFKCDPPPKACGESPHATAPNCPKGVYIQDGAVYHNGTKIILPEKTTEAVVIDGKPVECIALELIPYNQNGAVTLCFLKNGNCFDLATNVQLPVLSIILTPILLDENRVPIIRDMRKPVYPMSSEWGIMDCGIHPDLPALDPPQGVCSSKAGQGWKCGYEDTRQPDTSQTAQFSNAFPAYLESELVLNPDGKCVGTCRNYRNPTPTCTNKTTHCDLYRRSHCEDTHSDCMKSSKCPNQARRCTRTSREVSFCPSRKGTGHLYDWLKFDDAIRHSGISSANNISEECSGNQIIKLRERWEIENGVILKTPQYCEICLCVCVDPISVEGQHYFDISERLANTGEGYVVTGLRFEQKDNTMSLNIQHGKLLDDGHIDLATVTWLEANKNPQRIPLGSAGFLQINLDEISGKLTEVVTGIRWKLDGIALTLEVGVTEYISKPPSEFSKVNFIRSPPTYIRKKFDLTDVNSPLKQPGPSQPFPITDDSSYFIEFDASSLEKDAGQSVVPFFDLQPILSSDEPSPVPLAAVGILYKSKLGYGGFLAPTLRTFVHPYILEAV